MMRRFYSLLLHVARDFFFRNSYSWKLDVHVVFLYQYTQAKICYLIINSPQYNTNIKAISKTCVYFSIFPV